MLTKSQTTNFTISEYGIIRKKSDEVRQVNTLSELFVEPPVFDSLKKFAIEQEQILRYAWQKKEEVLQVQNFVGLLQTPACILEILPKNADNLAESRLTLLKMLAKLQGFPFKKQSFSDIAVAKLHLLDCFVGVFLQELQQISGKGMLHHYQYRQDKLSYIHGKICVHRQIKQANLSHFLVEFDNFTADIPPNRILKSTLLLLNQYPLNQHNKQQIRNLIALFTEIQASNHIENDIVYCQNLQRNYAHYEPILAWARVFLQGNSFAPYSGKTRNLSLLFSVEKLFENYIAAAFKKYLPDFELSVQDNSLSLLEARTFQLRPDLVLRKGKNCIVIDTKWKNIYPEKNNLGIDRSDLYQLYAYGKKYDANTVFIIYPKQAQFQEIIQLRYDSALTLNLIPFDLMTNLETETLQLRQYFLTQ